MTDRNLTEGSIPRALVIMSAPMSIGVFSIMLTGLADAFFLGRYGSAALAAVGFVYPVTITITSLGIGLSAGTNSVLSRTIGEKDAGSANRLAFHAVGIAAVLGLIVATFLYFFDSIIFSTMGAANEVLEAATGYAFFWLLSFPLLAVTMTSGAIMRARGDSFHPAGFMALEALVNLILTPILVFGAFGFPEMGAKGAGLATFLARAVSVTTSVSYLIWTGYLPRDCASFKNLLKSAKQIGSVALPAAGSNAINPAGMAIVTTLVATFGDAAVAGFGAAGRVQSFALVPMLALSAGIGPVVGQNWGANGKDRSAYALYCGLGFCGAYGLTLGLCLVLFGEQVAGFMTPDTEAVKFATTYLQIVGLTLFGYGFVVVANAAMNARDKALYSLGLSLGRIALIYVPLAWVLAEIFGYNGIVYAAAAANTGGAMIAVWFAWRTGLLRFRSNTKSRA